MILDCYLSVKRNQPNAQKLEDFEINFLKNSKTWIYIFIRVYFYCYLSFYENVSIKKLNIMTNIKV